LAFPAIQAYFELEELQSSYESLASTIFSRKVDITPLRLILVLFALTPPAIYIGAMMPIMSRMYTIRNRKVGHDFGLDYVVNTLLGSFLTGLQIIPFKVYSSTQLCGIPEVVTSLYWQQLNH
jgi:hypothetical protein